jgi:putative transcriptional regulator
MNLSKNMEITNNIHVLRAERRISQADLAEAIGTSRQTISAMEQGNYTPSLMLALKISMYFNKTIEEIFKLTEKD